MEKLNCGAGLTTINAWKSDKATMLATKMSAGVTAKAKIWNQNRGNGNLIIWTDVFQNVFAK